MLDGEEKEGHGSSGLVQRKKIHIPFEKAQTGISDETSCRRDAVGVN